MYLSITDIRLGVHILTINLKPAMMKRLLLLLLFSGIFSCATAQSLDQPQLNPLPDTDQLLKKGAWNVELNTCLGMNLLNGTYTYRVTPWLALGGGAGVRVFIVDVAIQVFARIQTEVPQWKVSPFFILDVGGACGISSAVDFIGNAVVGARFKLRNGNAFTLGVGTHATGYGIITDEFFPVTLLLLGYGF